jgi:alkylation response protein AidB-like acyl-CoA dehydrogenase
MLRSPARFQNTARKLVNLYRDTVASGNYVDPTLRDTVTRCWMDAEAYALNTYQTVSRMLGGGKIGAEASLNKIFWSELDIKMHETALTLLDARAELLPSAPGAQGVGDWLEGFIFALAGPIYAGTNEIQRNIIAERILGMPRK